MIASRRTALLDSAGRTTRSGDLQAAPTPESTRDEAAAAGEEVEDALDRALKLTDTGEGEDALRREEGSEERSAIKLTIPPRVPPNGPGMPPRPAFPSMQSSFATTYSFRSPASRTTSNTSIISVHESLPTTASIAPKSAPTSPYMYPYSPSHPSSPTSRWSSQLSGYGPPSRSPSIASESAYPPLAPVHHPPPASAYYYPSPYPVGHVPYPSQGMSLQPSSASAPFAHPGPTSSQVAFVHPFAGVDPAYAHHVNTPYGYPQNWHPAPVPAAHPAHPQNGWSGSGPTVYGGNGAATPSTGLAYGQNLGQQPVYLYPQPAVAGGFSYAAYPYPSAPVGAPGTAGYPHVPIAPAPIPQRYPSDPLSAAYSNPALSSPYSPQTALPAQQELLQYPISSARSSISSHPSSVPSSSWQNPNPQVPPVGVPPPPPPPVALSPRPSVTASTPAALPASPYHPPMTLGRLPTVGESQHSSGERTSLGSPAVAAHVSFAGITPPEVWAPAVSPTRSSIPFGASPGEHGAGPFARRSNLPRPPTHSPHALWVGNVPSDASHAELWQFFQTRPTPRMCGVGLSPDASPHIDLDSNGVESIHLIARSNCAFVNYLTPLHLGHAIAVSNNVSLRPDDPRVKKFVCRVRAQSDDARTGVGAQRLGGMHKAFRGGGGGGRDGERGASVGPLSPGTETRQERAMSLASIKSGSTTSSFLAKHFERRYFILKSHNERDLQRAVETGSWVTQAHNEPVLHQAFRTARSVYLIFGVNGAGRWFGYARMIGPIASQAASTGSSRFSLSSRADRSTTSTELRLSSASQTILEEPEQGVSPLEALAARAPLIPPSEHRFAAQSPQQVTPSPSASAPTSYAGRLASGLSSAGGRGFTPLASPAATAPLRTPLHASRRSGGGAPAAAAGGGGGSAPAALARPPTSEVPLAAQRAMSREQDLAARETADRLHLPPAVAEAARRAASLESGMPGRARDVVEARRASSTGTGTGTDGSSRQGVDGESVRGDGPGKELIAKAAEARNARLEAIETAKEAQAPSPGGTVTESRPGVARAPSWGSPFAIEWIKVEALPFARTRHIRNSFNGNREIKVSRDGTEIEPAAGELLLSEWWRTSPASSPGAEVPHRPASPQPVLACAAREADELLQAKVLRAEQDEHPAQAGAASPSA